VRFGVLKRRPYGGINEEGEGSSEEETRVPNSLEGPRQSKKLNKRSEKKKSREERLVLKKGPLVKPFPKGKVEKTLKKIANKLNFAGRKGAGVRLQGGAQVELGRSGLEEGDSKRWGDI